MNEDKEFEFKRCKSPMCSNIIYNYQYSAKSGYCSEDCFEDTLLYKRRMSLRNGSPKKVEKVEKTIDEGAFMNQEYPHRLYPDTVLIV